MEEILTRIWENLSGRVGGPMTFRLILQPAMAAIFAVRSGLKDAKEGRPAHLGALFSDSVNRRNMLQDGWNSVGRIFIFAIVMDLVYQLIVLRWFYPGEALLVAATLALLPYLVIRGIVNCIARRR
jgi:hypothetical protein